MRQMARLGVIVAALGLIGMAAAPAVLAQAGPSAAQAAAERGYGPAAPVNATAEQRQALVVALRARAPVELAARTRSLELCIADQANSVSTCRAWADRAAERVRLPGDAEIARWELLLLDFETSVDEAVWAARRASDAACTDRIPAFCDLRADWAADAARAEAYAPLILDPATPIGPRVAPARVPTDAAPAQTSVVPPYGTAPAASRQTRPRCERTTTATATRDPLWGDTSTGSSTEVTCGDSEEGRQRARELLRDSLGGNRGN
jgi:hypothetical protein